MIVEKGTGFTKEHNLIVSITGNVSKVKAQFGLSRTGEFLLLTNHGDLSIAMERVRPHLESIIEQGKLTIFTCYEGSVTNHYDEVVEGDIMLEVTMPIQCKDEITDSEFLRTLKRLLEVYDELFGDGK